MEREQQLWSRAVRDARTFLARWGDAFTRSERDDLAHDAALVACSRWPAQRDPERFPALVRTISRRLRQRAIERARRGGFASASQGDDAMAVEPAAPHEDPAIVRVGGQPVPQPWLLARLVALLPVLEPPNQQLVLGFYAGATCRQLGERFGLSEEAVKVRVHRTRRMLGRWLEAAARAAGHFEP